MQDPELEAAILPWKVNLTSLDKTILGESANLIVHTL